jgi:hypothetical protein
MTILHILAKKKKKKRKGISDMREKRKYIVYVCILIKELKKTKNIYLKFYQGNCFACLIVATALHLIAKPLSGSNDRT